MVMLAKAEIEKELSKSSVGYELEEIKLTEDGVETRFGKTGTSYKVAAIAEVSSDAAISKANVGDVHLVADASSLNDISFEAMFYHITDGQTVETNARINGRPFNNNLIDTKMLKEKGKEIVFIGSSRAKNLSKEYEAELAEIELGTADLSGQIEGLQEKSNELQRTWRYSEELKALQKVVSVSSNKLDAADKAIRDDLKAPMNDELNLIQPELDRAVKAAKADGLSRSESAQARQAAYDASGLARKQIKEKYTEIYKAKRLELPEYAELQAAQESVKAYHDGREKLITELNNQAEELNKKMYASQTRAQSINRWIEATSKG
jgi:hypothetical protein